MSIRKKIREGWAARHEPETAQVIVRRYWLFLIVLKALIVCGVIAYGAWEFSRPHLQNASSAVVAPPQVSLERAELQEVLDSFDTRVRLFQERQDAPAVADPS